MVLNSIGVEENWVLHTEDCWIDIELESIRGSKNIRAKLVRRINSTINDNDPENLNDSFEAREAT